MYASIRSYQLDAASGAGLKVHVEGIGPWVVGSGRAQSILLSHAPGRVAAGKGCDFREAHIQQSLRG
jgi:hypothetical protein